MQVNPADIRFTQDSISLYFQSPYDDFSVREAVRRISRNEMTPVQFPLIRVNSYGGCLWSIDNRRLWVFRFARCSSIAIKLVKKIHPRLKDVLSNSYLHSMMQVEDFFPRLRDRGQKDRKFDRSFPQPLPSLEGSVNEALKIPPINMAQVSNVDTENSGSSTVPPQLSINNVQVIPEDEHQYSQIHVEKSGSSTVPPQPSINHVQVNTEDEQQPGHIHIDVFEESRTTPPPKQSIDPMGDHTKDERQSETAYMWNVFAIARKNIADVGRMTRHMLNAFARKIADVGRKTRHMLNACARKIADVGRMTRDAVDSSFWYIISVASKTIAAVGRRIAS